MCTRGKQARSRNFRNLMEIKLSFYIQLVCKPYSRPVSYYIARGCFCGYRVRLLSILSSSRSSESLYSSDNNAKRYIYAATRI